MRVTPFHWVLFIKRLGRGVGSAAAQRAAAKRKLVNPDFQAARFGDISPPNEQQIDLAVILVHAGMLDGVKGRLLEIVQVASPSIRRESVHRQGDAPTGRWLAWSVAAPPRRGQ